MAGYAGGADSRRASGIVNFLLMKTKFVFTTSIVTLLVIQIAAGIGFAGKDNDATISSKSIEQVIKTNAGELMSIPGVIGIGQGLCDDKPCIKVFVDKKTPQSDHRIPETIEGFTVDIVQSGVFHTLPESHDPGR